MRNVHSHCTEQTSAIVRNRLRIVQHNKLQIVRVQVPPNVRIIKNYKNRFGKKIYWLEVARVGHTKPPQFPTLPPLGLRSYSCQCVSA
jgi:hypothetical protein